jgi:aquaporin Z
MGLTAVGLIYSPWGKRSGAHLNPSITLAFLRCGKIPGWDALFYVLAQFTGGAIGVLVSAFILGELIADPAVNYVVTSPGRFGTAGAFVAESAISFILMLVVLEVSNVKRLNGYTGLFAGALIAIFITFEAPISGTSMNPARSLGSALTAQAWTALWIYFAAPTLGMLAASLAFGWRLSARRILCAKLHHQNTMRCIFRCDYGGCDSCPTTLTMT